MVYDQYEMLDLMASCEKGVLGKEKCKDQGL